VPLTDEQQAIVDAVGAGHSLVGKALAGTGKTFALRAATGVVDGKALLLAYNRSIALEARRTFPDNVTVLTGHALAYRHIGHQYRDRISTSAWEIREGLGERFDTELRAAGPRSQSLSMALETMDAFLCSRARRVDGTHVPPEIAFTRVDPLKAIEIAQAMYDDLSRVNCELKVSHDLYLKVFSQSSPRLAYDLICFDEGQDLNGSLTQLAAAQNGAQQVFIGDDYQSIYSWRGSYNALDRLALPVYPLTQSWRFGDAIATAANAVLEVRQSDLRLRGNPAVSSSLGRVADPDVILTRTNAGAFKAAIEAAQTLGTAEKICFYGGPDRVMHTIDAAYALFCGEPLPRSRPPELRFFSSWAQLQAATEFREGKAFLPLVSLIETYNTQIPELTAAVRERITPHESEAKRVISTAHAFKGREAPQVRLGDDFSPFITRDERTGVVSLDVEEANLMYVALTRAQRRLDPTPASAALTESLTLGREHADTLTLKVPQSALRDRVHDRQPVAASR
jgi:hypothetical protein